MAAQPNYDVSQDTIFITGLPEEMNEEQLKDYFGQIGIIKFDKKNNCPKIWIYKDKATGKSKGEATITYDDPPTATAAISWFNGKELRGSTINVELAQRKSAPQFTRGGGQMGRGGRGGGDRGGYRNEGRGGGGGNYDRGGGGGDRGGRSGGGGRPGDWMCPSCSNNNFAYRQECNRCHTQKPAGADGGSSGGTSGGSHHNNGSSRYHSHSDDRSGGYSRGGGSSHHRNNERSHQHRDHRDQGGDRHRAGGGDKDRSDRDRDRDRDRNRSSSSYGGSGGGPTRSHMTRGREDRRSRPY